MRVWINFTATPPTYDDNEKVYRLAASVPGISVPGIVPGIVPTVAPVAASTSFCAGRQGAGLPVDHPQPLFQYLVCYGYADCGADDALDRRVPIAAGPVKSRQRDLSIYGRQGKELLGCFTGG